MVQGKYRYKNMKFNVPKSRKQGLLGLSDNKIIVVQWLMHLKHDANASCSRRFDATVGCGKIKDQLVFKKPIGALR